MTTSEDHPLHWTTCRSVLQDEFLELTRLASGSFGSAVKVLFAIFNFGDKNEVIWTMKSRHRLDGVVYAVKITKKKPKRNSRDEKVLLINKMSNFSLRCFDPGCPQ